MDKAAYRSGYWAALNAVLNYLNSLEFKKVDKHVLYHDIMNMRPPSG